ncbi:HlyD family secretion protein [Clostridium sp. SHJSY1]|uniref:HlyD family efflux transporter periplasmic adaptor subunit n=1 Tax=Clostridium sp. SHJSY1 TaxID=2942483 RepID=UPI00287475F1|nr:HlyD family efflux transporter periplasmic adaptor subunit [Clostridium sp. SHJSY1]MDS0528090.1 HlyD family secretion protein [Clostridium sp. SHJSY1]
MKYKIQELKDITDSREIMQSSPTGFSKYMTYIILTLLTFVVIWSVFAHKEVSVKATGTVRPRTEVNKLSSNTVGNITELNVKDGDKVKKGDILVVVNGSQYEVQRDVLQSNIDSKNKDLDLINKLKQSILDGENKFSDSDDKEKEYSKKYELYVQNLNASGSQQSLNDEQKQEINKNISDLELLKKSIEEGKNYLDKSNALYYQYNDYVLGIKKYDDAIKAAEDNINKTQSDLDKISNAKNSSLGNSQQNAQDLLNEQSKTQLEQQLSTLKDNLQSYKAEKDKLKNTTIMNITSEIQKGKLQLSQVQISSASSTYKEQYILNLDSNISSLQSAIDQIKMNLEQVNSQIETTSIKANSDGIVNMLSDIKVGDFIQNGTQIASIVPEDEANYNVEVYISNQNFGEIKDGQDVSIELVSLPGREYGYLKSNLTNISVDAKVSQEKGTSYYTATCPIEETSLKNKKGDSIDIKNGMLAEVRIINRKVSYFRYFLEKIDILD